MEFNSKNISIKPAIEMSENPFTPDLLFVVKKKVRASKIDFAHSISPLYYFSRAIGFLPYSIVFNSNNEIIKCRVSVLDLLWFVISIVFYLCFAIFYYAASEYLKIGREVSILYVGDTILIVFGLIYGAIVIIIDMINRNRIVDILKRIYIFDKEVNRFFENSHMFFSYLIIHIILC